MKTQALFAALLTLLSAAPGHAQALIPSEPLPVASAPDIAHLFPDYNPTIFDTQSQVNQLYASLYDANHFTFAKHFFGREYGGSQCWERAETWSYEMYKTQNVTPMKLFVFYTNAYKQYQYDTTGDKSFVWTFHVAPEVLVKDANGIPVEEVLDPSFSYMDPTYKAANQEGPLSVARWAALFVESGKPCKEWVKYSDFQAELVVPSTRKKGDSTLGTEHCYLVRVPATDFGVDDLEKRDNGTAAGYDWNVQNVIDAIKSGAQGRYKDDMLRQLGLK